jgi:uncharacterized protein
MVKSRFARTGEDRFMSMLLDLSRRRTGTDRLTRRFEPDEFGSDEEFRIIAPVDLDVEVHKDANKARLAGRVRTTLQLACSRCLEPFDVPVDSEIDVLFLPAAANVGEGEREVGDDDLGVAYYKDEAIDLGEVMREQFYLALPMKPLCQDDCRGLCPVCGVNRNRETCTCQNEWVDPRFEALKRLTDNQ